MLKKLLIILIFLQTVSTYSEEETKQKLETKENSTTKENSETKQNQTRYFYIDFQTAYYPPHALGTSNSKFSPSFITPKFTSTDPSKQIEPSSWGSAKLISHFGGHKFIPLQNNFDSIFFKNNGIDLDVNIGLSPILALSHAKIGITPIAFLNIYTESEFGIGWEAFGFKGIGVHLGNGKYSSKPEFYYEFTTGGRLQFDLNSIIDGEWTHVITVVGNNMKLRYNPHAKNNQLWKYKADEGKNINGTIINPYALLAYQMPMPLNLVGFLYEGQTYIGNARYVSTMQDKGWGSDFFYHNFSLIAKIQVIENLTLDVLFKFSTAPSYTEDTVGLADITKKVSTNNSYVYYDSIGLSLTYKI
ncbi:hypothetical protein [Borrelia duttonii]|uniref:Uncharacterized conserved protein n=1 Tax=Borrelia duttonii (strain Ly) TaxID=412419 RepID=B5RLX6_BORDL|nr:uncharacterized conserved protein [Borrelia duttonii Ly]